MQTSKILFTDLDGTLLDDGKNISQENRQAISRALSQGHRIVVASGRPLVSARAQSEKLGLNTDGCYVISYNGACIYDFGRKQILFSKAVPLDRLREIFDAAYSYMHKPIQIPGFYQNGIMPVFRTIPGPPAFPWKLFLTYLPLFLIRLTKYCLSMRATEICWNVSAGICRNAIWISSTFSL